MKIYYNENGFVCDVYPYYERTENARYIEATEEDGKRITYNTKNHAWKVINGQLQNVDTRTDEQIYGERQETLRAKRQEVCFAVVNRGQIWYDTLIPAQKEELRNWYHAWLDVTKTMVEPSKPDWI